MEADEKVAERRARRALHRRGLVLERNRVRDPGALGYGCYRIVDQSGTLVAGEGYTLSLAAAEEHGFSGTGTSRPIQATPRSGRVSLLVGEALTILKTLPANHFAACVTSPPYWFVRDNGHDAQIGLELTPAEYIAKLVEVFAEVRRVLRPDGTCWINVDDSYCTRRAIRTDGRRSVNRDMASGRNTQGTWRTAAAEGRTLLPSRLRGTSLKEKDMLLLPQRLAIALQEDGWFIRSQVIWVKTNGSPDTGRDRPAHGYEVVLMATKSADYRFAAHHLVEEAVDGGQRHGRDIWFLPPSNSGGEHTSVMPETLAERCIRASAPPRSEVLDPFGGAGTTGLVAAQLGRNATLIELSERHADLARQRLRGLLRP